MAADKESVAKGELSPSDQCCIQSGSGSSEFCRAAFGFFLLKGRRPKPMEDFHMAEFRHLEDGSEVESKGGFVLQRPGSITHRVDAKLAMSRAFGDADIKEHLSIEPDIYEARISEEDEILIVASDGVWQAMTCQEAVGFILSAKSPEVAARALARRAIDLGSADDISAIVIWLNQMVVP